MFSPFDPGHQARLVDVGERYRMRALGRLELQHAGVHSAQHALQAARIADRLTKPELRLLASEADVIRLFLERAVEPRRRDFEPLVSHALYCEEMHEMVAHARAILDVDTSGLVDENAHEPSAG